MDYPREMSTLRRLLDKARAEALPDAPGERELLAIGRALDEARRNVEAQLAEVRRSLRFGVAPVPMASPPLDADAVVAGLESRWPGRWGV